MKKAIGIITKNISDILSLDDFLDNAKKYNHKIDYVIITYSNKYDAKFIDNLRKRVNVVVHKINHFDINYFSKYKIESKNIANLLFSKEFKEYGLVPYGFNRNTVLLASIMLGIDYLFFIDTDVYPYVLEKQGNENIKGEIDFFGRHIEYLKEEDIAVTTSDYSGYYIVPPLNVEKMGSFFEGIQKEGMRDYLSNANKHNCLNFGNSKKQIIRDTGKILGGNLGLKVDVIKRYIPFFSDLLKVGGNVYLTRGEDTVLGYELNSAGYRCVDIDTLIFHDTFSTFPNKPNIIDDLRVKDRFFYATMGWIGRNPMLNWLQNKNLHQVYRRQKKALEKSVVQVSRYLDDSRFLLLVDAIDRAYAQLPQVIRNYENTVNAWKYFNDEWKKGWYDENIIG